MLCWSTQVRAQVQLSSDRFDEVEFAVRAAVDTPDDHSCRVHLCLDSSRLRSSTRPLDSAETFHAF